MLGVGWTEMLVIGVVALIVIGPRELPALMQRMGKVVGTIRRMGSDFQREINRSTGLDTVTDIRKSITEPLKKTTAEIRKEFNAIGANGAVKPTGVIKPVDPKAESVVDEIKAAAGMTAPADPVKIGAATSAAVTAAPLMTGAPVKAALPPRAAPAPIAPVAVADLPPTPEPVAKTPRTRAAKPKPVESPGPAEAIAPTAAKPVRKPRKKAASKSGPRSEPEPDKPAEGA